MIRDMLSISFVGKGVVDENRKQALKISSDNLNKPI
jgi:hypothetical protein